MGVGEAALSARPLKDFALSLLKDKREDFVREEASGVNVVLLALLEE